MLDHWLSSDLSLSPRFRCLDLDLGPPGDSASIVFSLSLCVFVFSSICVSCVFELCSFQVSMVERRSCDSDKLVGQCPLRSTFFMNSYNQTRTLSS